MDYANHIMGAAAGGAVAGGGFGAAEVRQKSPFAQVSDTLTGVQSLVERLEKLAETLVGASLGGKVQGDGRGEPAPPSGAILRLAFDMRSTGVLLNRANEALARIERMLL